MDKSAFHFAVALVLYPVLYLLTAWARIGQFLPNWTTWTLRTFVLSLVVLMICRAVPLRPGNRAAAYVIGIALGGMAINFWMNKGDLIEAGFGWRGMFSLWAFSLPIFVAPAAVIALLLWILQFLNGKKKRV